MTNALSEFRVQVARLARTARRDRVTRRAISGLFFGMLLAFLLAGLSGTVHYPLFPLILSAAAAGAGLAAGALSGLLSPPEIMRLLILADSVLKTRELASTALELSMTAAQRSEAFTDAILEDASRVLAAASPRHILGRRRLRILPFTVLAALLTAGALLHPVSLSALFASSRTSDEEIARIGEQLRAGGEKLAEIAQGQGLDRSLELSQQLAQLGSDLAAKRIALEDALQRMSGIESGLAQEYELRYKQLGPDQSGQPEGLADESASEMGDSAGKQGKSGPEGTGGRDGGKSAQGGRDSSSRVLAETLGRLKEAQRELRGKATENGLWSKNDLPNGSPGQDEGGKAQQPNTGPAGAGSGSESAENPGEANDSGIGMQPAPEKRGPASSITQGSGPNLQAQGDAAAGDSARLLARALPEWTGARLPEEAILNQYSRQAESAMAQDEVPLKLRQSVKNYFTVIGISK